MLGKLKMTAKEVKYYIYFHNRMFYFSNFYLLYLLAKLTPFNSNYSFTQMPEGQQFNLLQWHIHWRGSEHQLNGRYYPAEIHLVHQSASNSSQLAVVGFFIEVDFSFKFLEIFLNTDSTQ